jgi:hypothetical protein
LKLEQRFEFSPGKASQAEGKRRDKERQKNTKGGRTNKEDRKVRMNEKGEECRKKGRKSVKEREKA